LLTRVGGAEPAFLADRQKVVAIETQIADPLQLQDWMTAATAPAIPLGRCARFLTPEQRVASSL
jgi:hypothetical protein